MPEAKPCIECVMTWLLKGDGALCLHCRKLLYWEAASVSAAANKPTLNEAEQGE